MTSRSEPEEKLREASAVRESEQRFRRVFEEGPLAMALVDRGYRFTHVNNPLCDMLGYTEAELISRTFPEITHPDDIDADVALAERLFRGEILYYAMEKRYLTKAGEIIWINLTASVVRDQEGTPEYGLAMIEDITERKRAEEERELYRSMVTASSDLMVFVDSTYTYRAVNQAYCDEQARTQEEILGHTVAEVFGQEAFEATLKPHMDRCLAGEPVTFDFWWDSPSRGRRHVDVRYDPFFEADGSVSGVLVDVRDTTERKQMEVALSNAVRALEAANLDLRAFGDSLAHEIKNPLLTLEQFSSHLTETLGDALDARQEDYLLRIQRAARQMGHIVDDLHDLSDVNRLEIVREEVDLSSLGRDIIDQLSAIVPERDVRFEAEPAITAVGDSRFLRILLTNLLQNAWKYSAPREDALIELGVEQSDSGGPVYYVRDNGIGFDYADSGRIFETFERLHTEVDFAGSGLGLATAARIVGRHGGRIWAEGAPGQGATLRFTLRPTATELTGSKAAPPL